MREPKYETGAISYQNTAHYKVEAGRHEVRWLLYICTDIIWPQREMTHLLHFLGRHDGEDKPPAYVCCLLPPTRHLRLYLLPTVAPPLPCLISLPGHFLRTQGWLCMEPLKTQGVRVFILTQTGWKITSEASHVLRPKYSLHTRYTHSTWTF